MFNHTNLEIDRQIAPGSFIAGTSDLSCTRVNTGDAAHLDFS
jgi:hypothetical protein